MDKEQREAQAKWSQLEEEGWIWHMGFKPDTTASSSYEPLPDGDYTFVVVKPDTWIVDVPDWKLDYEVENWNDRQKVREAEGKEAKFIESRDELPFYKKQQIAVPLVVAEGEYKGRRLPMCYLGQKFNTDPKYLEKSNWYRLLKTLVPDLKKRAEANDIPDFEADVVGFRAIAEVETTSKNKNKVVAYRKHDKHFGKKMDDLELAALALAAGFGKSEEYVPAKKGDEPVPF